jgi:hypothetical protein
MLIRLEQQFGSNLCHVIKEAHSLIHSRRQRDANNDSVILSFYHSRLALC